MVLYDEKAIVEYDGLSNDNQIKRYDVEENRSETISFPPVAPLGSMVNFYLRCIAGKEANRFGAEFMEKLTERWRAVSREG